MANDKAEEEFFVCENCNGRAWIVVGLDFGDGRKPTPEVRPCAICNPEGKRGCGHIEQRVRAIGVVPAGKYTGLRDDS